MPEVGTKLIFENERVRHAAKTSISTATTRSSWN
jgi:hypothetical protein